MKKLLVSVILILMTATGCGNNKKTLECTLNDEKNIITIENNKIIKFKNNNEEEKVTEEEWKTLKNFYEFPDDVTTEDIAKKLKELNETIGYTCKIK